MNVTVNLAIGWLEEELEEDELGIVEGLEEDELEEFVEVEVPKLDACDELVLLDSEEEARAPHPDKANDAKPRIARSLNRFVFIKITSFLIPRMPPILQEDGFFTYRRANPIEHEATLFGNKYTLLCQSFKPTC